MNCRRLLLRTVREEQKPRHLEDIVLPGQHFPTFSYDISKLKTTSTIGSLLKT
ncbi:3368_t:CDS:2 [Acaulospora morrowiae]|uniref:3368_t:CDS:1 n=1 Tax=Acaulospora morrowiae TaxID=94023 RepID=A0A9N9BZX2_9GLOM|nr:3368_t:CDS:2 [Acaulospora morrowiae]